MKNILLILSLVPVIALAMVEKQPEKLMGGNSGTYTPKYLSVPGFKACLKTQSPTSKSDVLYNCLPSTKPVGCSLNSFTRLQQMNLLPCRHETHKLNVKDLPMGAGPVIAINGKPISQAIEDNKAPSS